QIDAPGDIYGRPATAFVADFVGEMNMLEATVTGRGMVQVGPFALLCPQVGQRAAGERVRIGLRPEEVRIRGLEPGAPNCWSVTVAALDFLGPFWRATLRPQQVPAIALRSEFSHNAMRDLGIHEGQTITVALPPGSLRVFAIEANA